MSHDDEIPDLLPAPRAKGPTRAEESSRSGAAGERGSGAPEGGVPSASSKDRIYRERETPGPTSGLLLDWGSAQEDRAQGVAATDDDEFDIIAATSLRSEELQAPQILATEAKRRPPAATSSAREFELASNPAPNIADRSGSVPSDQKSSSAAPLRSSGAGAPGPVDGSLGLGDFASPLDFDLDASLGLAPAVDLAIPGAAEVSPEKEGPWPEARTPDAYEHAISSEEVTRLSGFGPAGGLRAPLYFVSVVMSRGRLRSLSLEAQAALSDVEKERDQLLEELAASRRTELQSNPRFADLYRDLPEIEKTIEHLRQSLGDAEAGGARALEGIENRLLQAKAESKDERERCDERKLLLEEGRRALGRAQAMVSRLEIEKRNVEELAAQRDSGTGLMAPDLAKRYEYLSRDLSDAAAKLSQQKSECETLRLGLKEAERSLAERVARERAIEAEREAYLLSHEDALSGERSPLDEALKAQSRIQCDISRAILGLRGEVPVDRSLRERLKQLDEKILERSRQLELALRAESNVDSGAFRLGGGIFVFLACALLGFLMWALVS